MICILPDTGFWYALFDKADNKDQYEKANQIFREYDLESSLILLPWPILYETLNTRFNKNHLIAFKKLAQGRNSEFVDDSIYRKEARDDLFFGNMRNLRYENLSLVDAVLNKIILDSSVKIDLFITFNPKDFQESCMKRNISLIP